MNKIVNETRVVFLIIATLFSSALLSQTSLAKSSLNAEDEAMFSQNDILFYEPCGGTGGEKTSSEICGDNKNYAGVQVFTDEQMKAIKANQPFYQEAAEKYGIPWEVIAVIHKREHGLARSNPSNGQGVYQFASAERRASCKGGVFSAGKISDEQFQIQTNCAADAIKNSYGSGLDLNTDDGVKKMFFKYNGMAQVYIDQALKLGFSQAEAENGEGSPYVMNRYDEKREPSSTWGQIKRDYGSIEYPANNDFGAFTMYKALTCTGESIISDDPEDDGTESEDENDTDDNGSSSSNVSSSSDTAKKIAETALRLAYSYEDRGKADEDPKQEFIDATTELGTWDKNKAHGPDCGYFVKAVIATAAPDIVYKPKDEKMDPFRNQLVSKSNSWSTKDNKYTKEYWDVIDFSDGNVSKLQSGDIVWGYSGSKQHYFIVSEINGKLYKVEAHYGSSKGVKKRWGRVSKKLGKTFKTYTVQKIFRVKGGNGSNGKTPSCNPCEKGSKNINAMAACLAWPKDTPREKYDYDHGNGPGSATEAFQQAWKELGIGDSNDNSEGILHGWKYGAYCSGFTAAVVQWSGYDPKFTDSLDDGGANANSGQTKYAKDNSDLWDVIEWDGDASMVQGGDIINWYGNGSGAHSYIVIEDENGELWRAEANKGSDYGHITRKFTGDSGNLYIIRAKNANNSNVGVSVTDGVKSSSTSGIVTSSVQNSHDIGAVARYFAWPLGTEKSKYANYPKEKKAWKTLLKNNGFTSFGQTNMGHDCGVFVSGVLRYAGLTNSMGKQGTPIIPDEVDNGENGWYKVDTDGTKESDLQDGDVIYYYNDSGHTDLRHFAIFLRDENGKPLLAEAGHDTKYGLITEFSTFGYMSVFRNRNNKIGGNNNNSKECNLCVNEESSEDGGGGTLKDGGFKSVEEADKEVMSLYRQYKGNPEKDFSTASCTSENGSGCQVPSQDNCTTFSAWFIKTFLGWDTRVVQNYPGGAMGYALAGNIYKAYHDKYPELKMSNTPTPYSIASWNSSMPSPSGSSNHTAIILGVDVGNDNVIVGEAGWANHSFMGVHDKNYGSGYKLSKMKGKGIYVDFSAYVKNLQSS